MNFFKYKDQDGAEKVGSFFSEWNEVPFTAFLAWEKVLGKLKLLRDEQKAMIEALTKAQSEYEASAVESGSQDAQSDNHRQSFLKEIESYGKRLNELKETKQIPLEMEAISLFTDVSVSVLASMPTGKAIDLESKDLSILADLKDTNFNYLSILLYTLVNKPLPTNIISKFNWQSKTDAEILELENKYKAMGFMGRFTKAGRDLKQEIKEVVSAEYQVKDIWQHTTYANSQFQKTAKEIVADMQLGKWDNVPYLISMILVETKTNEKVLKSIQMEGSNYNPKEYLERYAKAYKEVFDRNQVLFFGQKQKLTIAHIIGMRNFFLSSQDK